jgi:hypothetical protein
MKHALRNQAQRTGITFAAAVAAALLGIGTAQAAPTFPSADISIEPRGEEAGGLTCSWRETGLLPSQVVYYTCSAGAVGVLKACVYKNRVIFESPTELDSFKNVVGEHGAVPFLSQQNGQIKAKTTTPIPEREVPEGEELCTAPSVEEVIAVRWCNAELKDTTNNLVGDTVDELFLLEYDDVGTVPSCADLLVSP